MTLRRLFFQLHLILLKIELQPLHLLKGPAQSVMVNHTLIIDSIRPWYASEATSEFWLNGGFLGIEKVQVHFHQLLTAADVGSIISILLRPLPISNNLQKKSIVLLR